MGDLYDFKLRKKTTPLEDGIEKRRINIPVAEVDFNKLKRGAGGWKGAPDQTHMARPKKGGLER